MPGLGCRANNFTRGVYYAFGERASQMGPFCKEVIIPCMCEVVSAEYCPKFHRFSSFSSLNFSMATAMLCSKDCWEEALGHR